MRFLNLGPNTDVVNGQMVTVRDRDVYTPMSFVPLPQRVPNITPTVPPMISGVGGPTSIDSAAAASANPWSFFHSPLPWAIGMLIVGLLGLRLIHWRAFKGGGD